MTRRKTRAVYDGNQKEKKGDVAAALKCTAATLCTAALLAFIGALISVGTPDPLVAADVFSYLSLVLSSLFGGVLAHFLARDDAVRTSLISGGAFVFLLALLSIILGGADSLLLSLVGYAACVILHLAGATLSGKFFSKKKRKRRTYFA